MYDDPSVTTLIGRARDGDEAAWDEIIERYGPLVWSICRRFRLFDGDAYDVAQNVWLRLVEQLDALREPKALPGWLATTTHRECLRVHRALRGHGHEAALADVDFPAPLDTTEVDQWLLQDERAAALRRAFGDLPPREQKLMLLLMEDPPRQYADISQTLGMPIGAIGPTRARSLNKLRQHSALVALNGTCDPVSGGGCA